MRLLVLSDSHGRPSHLLAAVEAEPKAELIYFLGDGERDLEMAGLCHPDLNVIAVRGNCDWGSDLPARDIRTAGGIRVLATHGYAERVKYGPAELEMAAADVKADLILFGHTHEPYNQYVDGRLYFNPGALADGRYGVIDIVNGNCIGIHKTVY